MNNILNNSKIVNISQNHKYNDFDIFKVTYDDGNTYFLSRDELIKSLNSIRFYLNKKRVRTWLYAKGKNDIF